ncbi:hypothetical protein TSOC_010922 [Tetrabaena socialis]|uniref:Uncharacterized protein n=1 Tax=Tetrabaena socialis TaxID=47790 RepID=A0A2J7ZRZ4_9CHLO|nr:hypothetical protein TSOC_010922 [Tetrabaena socialis]|eukprot:PNH03033.1 hypothetical protein TSOC_010922 [Tetrabaena socialis]
MLHLRPKEPHLPGGGHPEAGLAKPSTPAALLLPPAGAGVAADEKLAALPSDGSKDSGIPCWNLEAARIRA